jgi:hypothetical protein
MLVSEISLYYDARSKNHQTTNLVALCDTLMFCVKKELNYYI